MDRQEGHRADADEVGLKVAHFTRSKTDDANLLSGSESHTSLMVRR